MYYKVNVLEDFLTIWLCLPATSCCRIPRKFRGENTMMSQCSLLQRALEASTITHKSDEWGTTANLRCILNHPYLLSRLQLAQMHTRSNVLLNSWTWHLPNGASPGGPLLLPQDHASVWPSALGQWGNLSMEGMQFSQEVVRSNCTLSALLCELSTSFDTI